MQWGGGGQAGENDGEPSTARSSSIVGTVTRHTTQANYCNSSKRKGNGVGRRRVMHLHQLFGDTSTMSKEEVYAAAALASAATGARSIDLKDAVSVPEEGQGRFNTELCADIVSPSSSVASTATEGGSTMFSTSREVMNPALWSTLPDHLLDSILARLPLQSFFRFRTVCKSWNTHMYTGGFLEAYASTPSPGPWFFFFTHDERNFVSTYNSTSNKWHKLPLCPPHSNTNPSSAAHGGLVCYFSYENGSKSIVVSNPLTKSCRRLPPLLKGPSKVAMLAMVVDKTTKAYKVVVAGVAKSKQGHFNTEVYDSKTESWTTAGGSIPSTQSLKGKPVFSDGFLYVRSYSSQGNLLLAYDMEQEVWSDLQFPLPKTVRRCELLEWQGRILMVGELEENQKVQSICIWEQDLTADNCEWREVDRLPAGLFECCFGDKDYFQCSERDDVILDWCQAGRFVLLFTYNLYDVRGRCKLLVYDLAKRAWQKLQSFSCTDVCGTGRIIRGIFHEPRLDAKA